MLQNIFKNLPGDLSEEVFETIEEAGNLRIERIISKGHASPPDFWYDQDENEWVFLLQGKARLIFENEPSPVTIEAGDYLLIPAHQKHRVDWTTPDTETIWLAVFYTD